MLERKTLAKMRAAGYRLTKPRRAVVRVLSKADGFLTPEEILREGRKDCASLGLVTVYRTLDLLLDLGNVRRVHRERGCHGYARSELAHGHHLVCRNCNQAVEFPASKDLTPWMEEISQETGYLIEDHLLELLGLCPSCQEVGGD
jgi:Fe2+ or Zn2+ uptake regulation protein